MDDGTPKGSANGDAAAHSNGAGGSYVDTIILKYDRATDRLEIGGKCNSLDLMLDMLSRATRVIENKWRIERLQELQQQAAEAAQAKALFDSIRGRG